MVQANRRLRVLRPPNASIRERWLELLDLSYATRRVTHQEIEPGVHAVIAPRGYAPEEKRPVLEADVRAAVRQVPQMARGVRLSLEKIDDYELALEDDYRQWMGSYGRDIASGRTGVEVFIDLAYLEVALQDRLVRFEVEVDFDTPLAFFRRGVLVEYANVLEAVAAMVFEGRSLLDASDRLTGGVLNRLEVYADAFSKLSALYANCHWRIESGSFIMKVPEREISLALQYWDLRGDPGTVEHTLEAWRGRIESLLRETAGFAARMLPKSFAA